jgi:hypothetical protein
MRVGKDRGNEKNEKEETNTGENEAFHFLSLFRIRYLAGYGILGRRWGSWKAAPP